MSLPIRRTEMKKTTWLVLGISIFAGAAFAQETPRTDISIRENPQVLARRQTLVDYGRLPLSFEVNQGQAGRRVRFLAHNLGQTLYLTANEVVWVPSSAQKNSAVSSLRMRLLAANPKPRLVSLDELPGKANYFTNNRPESWRTNVATYAKIKYEQVYRGVDLVFHGNGRQLEFDYLVAPGADPLVICFRFDGAEHVEITEQGNLRLETRSGEVLLHRPLVYQEFGGSKNFISAGYALERDGQVRFRLDSYDVTRPLVIDPVLSYSTFLGGSGLDAGFGIAVDSAGNAYVTGSTDSLDFPLANPFRATSSGTSVFVSKLNPAGTALVYSTYLGNQIALGIAVDSTGSAYVAGSTNANDFPTTPNAFQRTCSNSPSGNCAAAFFAKLNPAGSALLYSTFLFGGFNVATGTAGFDAASGVAVDSMGNAYVVGSTASTSFPTTPGSFQTSFGGARDGFIMKIDPTKSGAASLVYCTYLGGNGTDQPNGIAVDTAGNAYVTGGTDSTNFPTMNPLQAAPGGLNDAFVAKLNASGAGLIYSTYLGGRDTDTALAIATDTAGNAYVTGQTKSDNFPLANPLQATLSGPLGTTVGDAFVTKINSDGSAFVYSTYLGGFSFDFGTGIAADSSGNAYVTGVTLSDDFPIVSGAPQTMYGGKDDAFVSELNPAGSQLLTSTFLGGSDNDDGNAIAVDAAGAVYVTGSTSSSDFPITPGAFQTIMNPGGAIPLDGFVAKISPTTNGNADLSATISGTPDPVNQNSTVTYNIVVTNHGPDPATGVSLINTLPTGLTLFLVPVPSQGTCNPPSTVMTCNLGTLASGATGTLSYGLTPTVPGTITNTVRVVANQADANLNNNSGSQVTTVLLHNPTPVVTGLVPSSAPPGGAAFTLRVEGSGFIASSVIQWNGTPLPTSQLATFLTAPIPASLIANPGTAQVTVVTPAPGGGTSNAMQFSIVQGADLSVTMTGSPTPAISGSNLTYTMVVTNNGPAAATGVTLTDNVPAASNFVSISSTQGTCSSIRGTSNCNIGNLAVAAEATVTMVVAPLGSGPLPNTASVRGNEPDYNPSNNSITFDGGVIGFGVMVTPSSVTVTAGQPANYTVTVTPQGGSFPSAVSLSCGSFPPQSSCQLASASVTPGANPASVNLTVATTARSAAMLQSQPPRDIPVFAFFAIPLAVGLSLVLSPQKRQRQFAALFLLLIALQFAVVLVACSGGSAGPPPPPPPPTGTPAGTYTITVTGMSGVAQSPAQFQLIVQ